ncbi:TPA: EAL domain-containing protein [Klebsiella pneumoniae]
MPENPASYRVVRTKSYLFNKAFDKIKIDRSFVINIPEQKDDLDIVRLIISMGKSLHMRIVAEGVETEEQLASLQALGCDLVQGYLIGKPSPLR